MSITNHFLVGSSLALTIDQPVMAILLAYCSHFALDSVPHFGYPGADGFVNAIRRASKYKLSYIYVFATAITLLVAIVFLLDHHLYLAIAVGIVAMLPDVYMALYYLLLKKRDKKLNDPISYINIDLHGKIQFERPWGIYVELFVFMFLAFATCKLA